MAEEIGDRNVFILGAGFSAAAGAPLIHDFLDRAREFFDDPSSGLDSWERNQFQRVFEFRREMAQAREKVSMDLDNIEQLFGLVEMSQRLGRTSRETRYSTVYLIAKTLEIATRQRARRTVSIQPHGEMLARIKNLPSVFTAGQHQTPPPQSASLYDFFASLLYGAIDDPDRRKFRKNSVITFNYDLVLDDALRRVGVEPLYHLGRLAQTEPRPPVNQPRLSLLKLHGSTNWGVCTKCTESVIVLPEKVTSSPSEFRSRRCDKCHQQAYQPLLVPPSWDKSEYREIVQPVWEEAVKELEAATRICVIGYSMPETDAFFKFLITLSLSHNHQLYKLIVVDMSEEVKRRYEDLLDPVFKARRFSFHGEGFEMFVGNGAAYPALGRAELIAGVQLY